jgi:hypothetical protein
MPAHFVLCFAYTDGDTHTPQQFIYFLHRATPVRANFSWEALLNFHGLNPRPLVRDVLHIFSQELLAASPPLSVVLYYSSSSALVNSSSHSVAQSVLLESKHLSPIPYPQNDAILSHCLISYSTTFHPAQRLITRSLDLSVSSSARCYPPHPVLLVGPPWALAPKIPLPPKRLSPP